MFKKCSSCHVSWESQSDFLKDKFINLDGYKADFNNLEAGLFFFNHSIEGCKSSLALNVGEFANLYTKKRPVKRMTGRDGCPGFCLDEHDFRECFADCECTFVRDIIIEIKKIAKTR